MSPLQVVLTLHGADWDPYGSLQTALQSDGLVRMVASTVLSDLPALIQQELPDLLLIHTPSLAVSETAIAQICQIIRSQGLLDYRPVLVLHTGDDAELETRRIEYFIHGADDVLPVSLSEEELRVRLLAHLRRHLDTLTNHVTLLPDQTLMGRMLQRTMTREHPWAMLVAQLKHFDVYQQTYGRIPAQQVLKTIALLLGNLIRPPDWAAHLDLDQFAVLTIPDKADKLAAILCRQFDGVAHTFYSEQDVQRGFTVVVRDGSSIRMPLLKLNVALVDCQVASVSNHQGVLTTARQLLQQMPRASGSQWTSECLKLGGGPCDESPPVKPTVLVVESDAAMAFLLKTTLEMQDITVDLVHNPAEALAVVRDHGVSLVILDSLIQDQPLGWALCRSLKQVQPRVPVLMASTLHDREQAMQCGVDVYVPKPFELIPFLTLVNETLVHSAPVPTTSDALAVGNC